MRKELLGIAVITALGCFALGGCGGNSVGSGHSLSQAELQTAENAGFHYASNAGLKFLACSGIDSEPDGYVSCDASQPTGGPVFKMLCSYEGGTGGCKSK